LRGGMGHDLSAGLNLIGLRRVVANSAEQSSLRYMMGPVPDW